MSLIAHNQTIAFTISYAKYKHIAIIFSTIETIHQNVEQILQVPKLHNTILYPKMKGVTST